MDENHVYLRVTWLYRPQYDLSDGPAEYHGRYELVPSTEVQIIDAMTVDGSITVRHWDEYADDDVPEAGEYYWRQYYNFNSSTLSECRLVCSCRQPQNLDYPIFQCQHCQEWMHGTCIEDKAVCDVVGKDAAVEQASEHNTDAINGTTPTKNKGGKGARTKITGKGKAAANGTNKKEPDVAAKLEVDSSASDDEANGVSSSQCQLGTSKLVVTDRRGEEPVTTEIAVECLFCEKNIDG